MSTQHGNSDAKPPSGHDQGKQFKDTKPVFLVVVFFDFSMISLMGPILAYLICYAQKRRIGIDRVMPIVHLGLSGRPRGEHLVRKEGLRDYRRSLGTVTVQIADLRIQSGLKLDEWTNDQVDSLEILGGNDLANRKYEALLPDSIPKPRPDSSNEERADFIKRKYEMLQFFDGNEHVIPPHPPHEHSPSSSSHGSLANLFAHDKRHYEKQPTRHRMGHKFRNSWVRRDNDHQKSIKKSDSLAGMVEFIGMIKVNVVKGTNLAVRDMVSSDPYVMLTLGQQSVKTRVIKNNLNPVWNESLMLSIPDHIPPLKVIVYDKDTFSHDDFMGEAEIDIQPLVTAAQAHERSEINESMQLGKSVASKDNTLEKDGIITVTDGRVKQDISVRLQKVERGVLDIEVECVPLTQ
ncbi:hypothetical protein V6N13_037934 [Hibiscus sabdariffa]|uniref:C2 domain-containing protein n=1 Tax=Hibiscus sabdariffa TaxID=183260 RepID=A0ABR2S4G8_9ROSI